MVAFNGMCGLFIGVWSITLLLEHLFMVFYFLEGSWPDTFDFWSLWLLSRCLLWTTWGSGTSVAPPLPWATYACLIDTSLVLPGIHSVIFLRFEFFLEAPLHLFGAFSGTLAWCVLVVLRHAFLAHVRSSLARLIASILLGAIILSGRVQWPCEPLGSGFIVWDRVISSPYLLHWRFKNCLAWSRLLQNSG